MSKNKIIMPNYTNNRTRRFSYTEPILYMGESYPSAKTDIVNDRGLTSSGTIFATNNGEYYTLDSNGNAIPAIISEELPEVEVRPSQDEILSAAFNRYLTMSNDKSRVNNVPHREYNLHLRESTLNGAKAHASWDKEHPNLAAWRDFTTAIPFGIASIPLAGGLGETALGQAVVNGVGKAMANPAIKAVDNALGLGFGTKGAYDVSQGDVTPSTLIELAGIYPGIKAARGLTNTSKPSKVFRNKETIDSLQDFGNVEDGTFKFNEYLEDPLLMHIKRAKAKGYDTSNITILDISKDTPENKGFFERTGKIFNMTPNAVRTELLEHMDKHGHASVPNWEKVIIHDGKGGETTNAILSHEFDHLLHTPDEPIPDGTFFPRIKNIYGDEFIKQNNTEVAARGSQLHDYFGHTGNEPITEDMLKYARDNYVKDTGINNDMNALLWSINDYKGLADWMTKYATGIIPFSIGSTVNSQK